MFSSALKSFSSNISSNYTLDPKPTSTAGPWNIYDAKSKRTGKAASVFVFDKRSLDPQGGAGYGARSNASGLRRAHMQVLERLKREASSLARLRHPSILELAEPVEETSKGGLMFVTEAVVSSLAELLKEKDERERSGSRASRFVVDESDGTHRRRELEIDELEIQKGLLQLAKGLEFLHESAGLVHANLTPDTVLVNAKGDWKISGLAFCGPHENGTAATSLPPISLHEALNHDPRLPRSAQLNIDYTSPDFVLDNTLTASADMFSLGLLIVALYNHPHTSPLSTGGSLSSYKRIFASSSAIPTYGNNYLVPSSHPLPPTLASELLPKLITRRPAQRLSAREFQQASYFDNILVSTIRFLEDLPAKTPKEKMAFLRGLPKIMPQFPTSVLEKKLLPALLEEMKDRDLLASIMTNVFAMVRALPSGKRVFTERVVPKLREIFLAAKSTERDTSKEAAIMILLENMEAVAQNCAGKEFTDDILPILGLALESSTHAIVDVALSTLPFVLPSLDFSTIKNELFPVIAQVFSKTSSLNIKIRGLEAFNTLCGGTSSGDSDDDDLNGLGVPDQKASAASSSIVLDKYTIQEKVVPLLKGIKTKEPGVMMAALKVFQQVGKVADTDFLAMDVLPGLWSLSLGPLLNLQQFQAFMALIKDLSSKIEREQTRKLQELSSRSVPATAAAGRITRAAASLSAGAGINGDLSNGEEADFETLVSGRKQAGNDDLMNDWAPSTAPPSARSQSLSQLNGGTPFSWQTPASTSVTPQPSTHTLRQPLLPTHRTITPDLAAFSALTPSSQYSQPLEPHRPKMASSTTSAPLRPTPPTSLGGTTGVGHNVDCSAALHNSASIWSHQQPPAQQLASLNGFRGASKAAFALPPPPSNFPAVGAGYGVSGLQKVTLQQQQQQQQQQQHPQPGGQKTGLDKYESLI